MGEVASPVIKMETKPKAKVEQKTGRDNDRVERSSFKRDRPAPYNRDGGGRGFRPGGRAPPFWRVFVNNIPYEEKWQNLKDTFRREVGEVTYVELFKDDQGKSRGYGVVEFKDKATCEQAIEKMNRFEIANRKLVVKADYDGELVKKMLMRDGGPRRMGPGPGPMPGLPPPMPGRHGPLPPMPPPMGAGRPMALPNPGNERQMNQMMNRGPLGKTVFVANLDYNVTYSKLKEVFQLAGQVIKVDLMLDKDNKSRGMATVTYNDSMEAQQAISMLNQQRLFNRIMNVKMDKDNLHEGNGSELPSGLSGIGPSLAMRRDHGGLGDAPLNRGPPNNMSASGLLGLSALSSSLGNGADFGGLRDVHKNGSSNPLTMGLSALNQQASRLSETLQAGSIPGAGLGLAGISGLGIGDFASSVGLGSSRDSLDQRLLDQHRLRLLAAARGVNSLSDRERIEMDIARVDNRIRDIDRSLAATERGGYNHNPQNNPPMPPPMKNDNYHRGGNRLPGTTVFVRNLPYSLTWQKLRDKFARCGNVMFADIKMDNGKSRGFGNVRFEMPEQAEAAVRYFNGFEIDGRKIDVHLDNRG